MGTTSTEVPVDSPHTPETVDTVAEAVSSQRFTEKLAERAEKQYLKALGNP